MTAQDHAFNIKNGLTGAAAGASAAGITFIEALEVGLRITGSFLGCVVCCITIYRFIKRKK